MWILYCFEIKEDTFSYIVQISNDLSDLIQNLFNVIYKSAEDNFNALTVFFFTKGIFSPIDWWAITLYILQKNKIAMPLLSTFIYSTNDKCTKVYRAEILIN